MRPAVFLTGGIGINPVRSIVLQSVHDDTGHTITVFDSNKRPEDAAFLDEFKAMRAVLAGAGVDGDDIRTRSSPGTDPLWALSIEGRA